MPLDEVRQTAELAWTSFALEFFFNLFVCFPPPPSSVQSTDAAAHSFAAGQKMLDIISQLLSDVHTLPFLSSSSFLSTGSRRGGVMDILCAVGRREEIDRLVRLKEVKS